MDEDLEDIRIDATVLDSVVVLSVSGLSDSDGDDVVVPHASGDVSSSGSGDGAGGSGGSGDVGADGSGVVIPVASGDVPTDVGASGSGVVVPVASGDVLADVVDPLASGDNGDAADVLPKD